MCRIVICIGLPGSGKSTYLREIGANALSSDEMRRLIADDPTDQSIHHRVFAALRYLLRHRIENGREITYIDATNLTRRDRRAWVKFAEIHGCQVEALFFDTPLNICLRRNAARGRVVPEPVMLDMARKLAPPSFSEGFTRITVVRDLQAGSSSAAFGLRLGLARP